ncbi:MAG: relaxase/mobilization nuclease domain-containing protein [Cyclobacteriaceae bacterium]|nr:relaxase/mobilization nuclease domain-containing protein [Cyclobacteriaceae bacterium]
MVTVINSAKRMLTILNYNENKVKEGVAKCILENSFGRPVEKLTFNNKVNGLEAFSQMNRRATSKAVHISINFHPEEKLTEQKLRDIANDYMDMIGFGKQPYLVYQHFDAGHPHIHVVTTNIQRDGSRIIMYNIGWNQSKKARLELEKKYGLMKAKGRTYELNPDHAKKIVYGKSETRRSISNVVTKVVQSYFFTSLPEFNAVLRQFNIIADRGAEDSRVFKHGGLQYRILDGKGNKTGVPIKAYSIVGRPTLTRLEKLYKGNERLRGPHRSRVIKCFEDSFGRSKTLTRSAFIGALQKQNIYTLFRENDEGRIYGVTFVDNETKAVFNGSDLGKPYAAKALTERLTGLSGPTTKQDFEHVVVSNGQGDKEREFGFAETMEDLAEAKAFDHTSPDAAMKRKRKKRKGKSI